MPKDTLTIIDNRTEKSYEIPVQYGAIDAMALRKIKVDPSDFGLMTYDPGFANTASCKSAITYIDGDKGILLYRGYPIQQLAEKSTYLETAYLLLNGDLPSASALKLWQGEINIHTMIHENIKDFMKGFRYDAHPMAMLMSTVAALSTFYSDAKTIQDPASRHLQVVRLIGKMITLAAFAYRHSMGMRYIYPDNELTYTGNFLNMMYRIAGPYEINRVYERALDILFILHADHEQNCGTHVLRSVASSHVDPYTAVTAAIGALYGPLHGGANEAVIRMLMEIGSKDRVPEYVRRVKAGEFRLMGFGHRVYKSYDPRAKIIKEIAYEVFAQTAPSPLLEVALELERIALEDEYFVARKLYPNVDFYSGLIYQAMGFPITIFPVLFAIPRVTGWLAQWLEFIADDEQKIARPRQLYLGKPERDYVPIGART
ncbi:MAG: citrate (Si)-synthase [Omnitrophica WOR_2 bacterium GWA2_47_8]|nr:MAG: citrate (Si)-synthase [Omnitrophica WOR_2 bacterium GWA2_47_8]